MNLAARGYPALRSRETRRAIQFNGCEERARVASEAEIALALLNRSVGGSAADRKLPPTNVIENVNNRACVFDPRHRAQA
jgi:hypothetical protein